MSLIGDGNMFGNGVISYQEFVGKMSRKPCLGNGVMNFYRKKGKKFGKWECCCRVLGQPIEDEKPLMPQTSLEPRHDGGPTHKELIGFQKDLNSLPIAGSNFLLLSQSTVRNGWLELRAVLSEPLTASDFSLSGRKDGSKVRVAFQGVPGSYSEDAALKAYPNCETVPCDGFEDAFKAVELWLVDRAVIPIENTVGGSLHRNYDLLLRHRLHIVGEVKLDVNHCLMGLPGVRKEDLKRVLSHPQALNQCEATLTKLGLVRISTDDTAGAAQIVASQRARDTGAVASARAAAIYGLDVLEERIQDDEDNITRFMILAREPIIAGIDRPHKTSVVFTLDEGPGVLFKALAVFALRDINLTKIESRPQKNRPLRIVDDSNYGSAKYFDYLFFIDFQASMADPQAQFALGHLQEFASFLRVLGCYPMDTSLQ